MSGAAAPRTSSPTFPPMTSPTRLREAALAIDSFLPNIPNNPTPETTSMAGICNPNNTREGRVKMIHGAKTK